MQRIRDYNISRVLEKLTGKKLEYIMDSDLALLNNVVIKNQREKRYSEFTNVEDLEFLRKLPNGVTIEFEGFNLKNITFEFISPISKIVIKDCIIDNFKIEVKSPTEGYELVLNKVKIDGALQLDRIAPQCKNLKIIGKTVSELTKKYTFDELNIMMNKIVPDYSTLDMNEQVILLKENGFIDIHPQKLESYGIDKLDLLESISLSNIEVDEIRFSQMSEKRKNVRLLDEICFRGCNFNEANVTYRQPVKRLVIDNCVVNRKNLLPNFSKVNAIEVVNTKGMELPKLNDPKLLKGLKIVSSDVNLETIKNVKYLEDLIILDQNLNNIDFIKKLKKLKYFVVSKNNVGNADIVKKRKKLNYLEVESDNKASEYNKLFV